MEVAVIGLGRFGSAVAKELSLQGVNVLAIDKEPARAKVISDFVDHVVILDGTDEKALSEISINHVDTVVVGMGKSAFNESLLTCLALKKVGVTNIVAKATSEQHAELLQKIGVTRVVNPEYDMGQKVARQISHNSFFEYIMLSEGIRIEGVVITDRNDRLINRTISEINLRKNYGINIVCIKRDEDIIIAEHDTMILPNDVILLAGDSLKIDKFESQHGLCIKR